MLTFDKAREPRFLVASQGGDTHEVSVFGLVFWKVKPTVHGILEKVIIDNEGGGVYPTPHEGVMAEIFSNKLLEYVWNKSDEDQEIVKAREMHGDLLKRVSDLKVSMENEIKKWAK